MFVIGVVGGIASGKSAVSRMMEEFGATVLNADRVGHEVLEEEPVIQLLDERWGMDVMTLEGAIDRQSVASRVFGDSPRAAEELRFLESVTHPRIGQRLQERIDQAREETEVAVVLDAPLLFEAEWDKLCDFVIFVDASWPNRRNRALERGWSEKELKERETSQDPIEIKRERADWTLSTDVPLEETRARLLQWWVETVEPTRALG